MDEAQALADRVVVVAGGRVVATGTPADLGGRDTGAVRIRFRLPPGVEPPGLGEEPTSGVSDGYELTTTNEVHVLHQLTGWALTTGHQLEGLTADRPSLEDVYLRLVADAGDLS
jgi:ABC-2 type transport system ATP-binding protein